jgi:hypothetical protein
MLAVRGSETEAIVLLEASTGAERGHIEGHPGLWFALAFGPDSRTLVTGGEDTTALVWDVFSPTIARSARPREANPDALWRALASTDARAAHSAAIDLVASPREGVALLAKKLSPTPRADPAHLARLIADLDHDDFPIRERATAALETFDRQAAAALQKALAGRPSEEAKHRLEGLLVQSQSGEAVRGRLPQARALEALEHMNVPEARDLLERLAKGAPDAWITAEARAALRRLERR